MQAAYLKSDLYNIGKQKHQSLSVLNPTHRHLKWTLWKVSLFLWQTLSLLRSDTEQGSSFFLNPLTF